MDNKLYIMDFWNTCSAYIAHVHCSYFIEVKHDACSGAKSHTSYLQRNGQGNEIYIF